MPESENQEVAPVVEDKDNYMSKGLTVDQNKLILCKIQKRNSNFVISRTCIKPEDKFQLKIPICRLRPLLLVRPINEVDVQRLENEFVTSYKDGD